MHRGPTDPDKAQGAAPQVPALHVQSLTAPGLRADRLWVEPGACVAVRGKSGAGKSRLLRALADLDPNHAREMASFGVDRGAVPAPRWRRLVPYVPAESGWWAATVGEHFADEDAAAALLEHLDLEPAALDWPVARLSTGERQRLALARALAGPGRMLLLDEPTSALDETSRDAVASLLESRLARGAGILLVTHDDALVWRLSAQSVRVEDGIVLGDGAR